MSSILYRPAAEWIALRQADRGWVPTMTRHALPWALLPSVTWPFGQAASGMLGGDAWSLSAAFFTTLVLSLASVLLFAAGLFLLSPFFGVPRHWSRSVAVAAHASTPVFAYGIFLVVPMLVVGSIAAFVYCFLLCDMGVQRVLECPEADTAGFVASAIVFAGVTSAVLGGLCSAVGLI